MSSELQLDVRHHIQWRRHLVNAYEIKAGMVLIVVKTVWSMSERFEIKRCIKALYKYSSFLFPFLIIATWSASFDVIGVLIEMMAY